MKFAYLILAHQYPSQLCELVNQLQDGENYFFIHIDEKVDQESFQKQKYLVPENVFFCNNRVNVSWGGFNQVIATLHLIQDFIEKNIYCEYIHLISGQDFPIKTNEYMKYFFEQKKHTNFICYFPLPYQRWPQNKGLDRIHYKWQIDEIGIQKARMQVRDQKMKEELVPFPEGYNPYGGDQWWSLTYECIAYLAKTCNPDNILYNFYKTTLIPDEMFFQTLLMHSEFKNTIENTHLHYIDWDSGPERPKCLRMEDFDKLKQSENLFARKFNDFIDYRVKYKLRNEILTAKTQDNIDKQTSDFRYAFLLATHQINDFVLQQYNLLQQSIPSNGDLFLLIHHEEEWENLNLPQYIRYYTFNMDSLNALEYYAIDDNIIPGSNHFPVLQFYKDHPEYDYYWNIEYDVHFSGNWNDFFETENQVQADLLTSHIRKFSEEPSWYWWQTLILKTMKISTKDYFRSFNPIYRISKNALVCIDECLLKGNAGHHEVLIPTILNFLGYTIADFGGSGTFAASDRKNKWYFSEGLNSEHPFEGITMRYRPEFKNIKEINQKDKLYHPVKFLLE